MNRQSVSAAVAAVVFGTTMLLSSGVGVAAAQACTGCSQSTGLGTGRLPAVDPGVIVHLRPQPH